MRKLPIIIGLVLTSSLCFSASITSLNPSETKDVFNDKTITTIDAAALNGKILPNRFTGYFAPDGKMNGAFATAPVGAPQNDKGTWKINSDGLFCVTWEHWFSGKEGCLSLYKLNNGILIINTENNFESLVLNAEIKQSNQMK